MQERTALDLSDAEFEAIWQRVELICTATKLLRLGAFLRSLEPVNAKKLPIGIPGMGEWIGVERMKRVSTLLRQVQKELDA